MSYSHSFSPEFYMADDSEDFRESVRPTTVRQALYSMPHKRWLEMCEDLYPDAEASCLDVDTVMDTIMETNTVSNLNSPVRVWIDPEGFYTVEVYDKLR